MGDAPTELDPQMAGFGARLRELRGGRGWTLEELSERTGLSKPFLSRLEGGDRQPSIAAVLTLSRVYGVSLSALFEQDVAAEPCVIVRKKEAQEIQGDGLRYAALSSARRFANLQPIRLTVQASRRGDERFQHEGEEWVHVLSGRLRILLADKSYDLAQGDSAHFDSRVPHRLAALGGKDVELIVVACPLPEQPAPAPGRPLRQRRAIR